MPHRPSPSAYAHSVFKAVAVAPRSWWILGPSNVITVDIPLLEAFVPGSQSLIADVKIGRKDNWKSLGNGEMRELSVVSASLNGLVVPHGIRYVRRHPSSL